MPITDWFSRRQRYTRVAEPSAKRPVPDGIWSKCASCGEVVYQKQIQRNFKVCPHCQHHFEMSAVERIAMFADEGSFDEFDADLTTVNPLGFAALKTYEESVEKAKGNADVAEAIMTGTATFDGRALVIGAMDFRFIGGSMGSVVGEKVARAFEHATQNRLPVLMIASSGGARMQEGMLSLMQMAKTSAAVGRFKKAGPVFIAVLANPSTGGVLASFPALADIIIAEPKAHVGFTGPRVIEDTIKQKLPAGFQTAEFFLEHGMVDMVLPRELHRETLARLLDYMSGGS